MKNIVIIPEAIDGAGAMSYWKLSGATDHAALDNALTNAGVSEEMKRLPELPTAEVALRRAVKEQRHSRRLVRPLKDRKGWIIVNEQRGAEDNRYDTDLKVRVNIAGRIVFEPCMGTGIERSIEEAFERHFSELSRTDLSGWLVKQVETCQSVRLRDGGGVYFVPPAWMPYWRKIKQALKEVNGHKIYLMPAVSCEDVVETVMDAITDEVQRFTEGLDATLDKDELGARALRSRTEDCDGILQKVGNYEKILGTKLGNLRSKINDMKTSVSAALLAAEAEEDKEHEVRMQGVA